MSKLLTSGCKSIKMANKKAEKMNLGSNSKPLVREMHLLAYERWLSGATKASVAEELGKSPKTIGIWIKNIQDNTSVDVSGAGYEYFLYNLMEQLDHTIKLCRTMAVMSYREGDKEYSFGCLQNAIQAEKRKNGLLNKAGLQFKSNLENENTDLKNLCAYFLIVINKLECLFDDHPEVLLDGNSLYSISLDEILEVRKSPEMLKLSNHLEWYTPPTGPAYLTLFDLEKILLSRFMAEGIDDWSALADPA